MPMCRSPEIAKALRRATTAPANDNDVRISIRETSGEPGRLPKAARRALLALVNVIVILFSG